MNPIIRYAFFLTVALPLGIGWAVRSSAQQAAPEACTLGDAGACDDGNPCTDDACVKGGLIDAERPVFIGACRHTLNFGPQCVDTIPLPRPEPTGCDRFGTGSVDFQCCQAGFDLDSDPENFKCCETSVSLGGPTDSCAAPTPTPLPTADTPPPAAVPEPQPEPAPPPVPASPEPAPPAATEPTAPSGPVCDNGIVETGEECDGGPACDVECHFNIASFPDCRIPEAELRVLKPFELISQYGFDAFEKCARIGGGGGAGLERFDPKDLPVNRGAAGGGCSLIF